MAPALRLTFRFKLLIRLGGCVVLVRCCKMKCPWFYELVKSGPVRLSVPSCFLLNFVCLRFF